jgi:hypothetical protein
MHIDLVFELVARGKVLEALFIRLAPGGSVGTEQRAGLGAARLIPDLFWIAAIGQCSAMVEGLFLASPKVTSLADPSPMLSLIALR